MENLPPELLDEIISYLPQDKRLLRNYSLVARSWTYPCQSRLLETIEKLFESVLWRRLDGASPGNVEVLHCVRSLSLYVDVSLRERSEALAHFHHNEFPLFPRLGRMVLCYRRRTLVSPQLGLVLAPQNTLEYLSLRHCRVAISALVTLINHFPNLAEVQLISLMHEVNHEPTTSFTRPLVKLSIVNPDTDNDPSIVGQFLEMQPRCDEVTIGTNLGTLPSQTRLLLIQRVIDGVPTTIKRLNLKFLTKHLEKHFTLANFPELCELMIHSLSFMEPPIISTITSSHIRKITFIAECKRGLLHWFNSAIYNYFPELDACLRQVADQLTHELPLNVEIRLSIAEDCDWDELHLEEQLPRVHEKGRVRVVDHHYDEVLYCSDGTSQS